VAVVPFLSPRGDVIAVEPEVEYLDSELVRVRFDVDESEWLRIVDADIFGARSRRRFPDDLDGSGPVRVTVESTRLVTESPRGWDAQQFVVVTAMRRAEDRDEWSGMMFASAPAWHRAVAALIDMGYVVDGETDDEVSATDATGCNVMVSVYTMNQVATVVFARQLPRGSSVDAAVTRLLNALNASFVIGSVAASDADHGSFLLVRSAVPTIAGVDVPVVLEALVIGLTGMMDEIHPLVLDVLGGRISVDEAIVRLT